MTEISQSHGTLNSMTDDSSTPSNNSQYFSVTSSLDILNCTDDVYYSMDEDLEKEFRKIEFNKSRNFECNQIIIENFVDFDEDFQKPLTNDNEDLVDHESWDKICDNFVSYISQESVSSDDDDTNNYSGLTDSVINTLSNAKHESDNEENTSISVNNVTQMTNSIIEGELSEINDIVYESSISQEPFLNDEDDDNRDNLSFGVETEEEQMMDKLSLRKEQKSVETLNSVIDEEEPKDQHDMSILEIVRRIEFSELEYDDQKIQEFDNEIVCEDAKSISNINEHEIENVILKDTSKLNEEHQQIVKVSVGNDKKKNVEIVNQKSDEIDLIVSYGTTLKDESHKSNPIEIMDESPIKSSSFCCSIKRKKIKGNSTIPKVQTSTSKSLFSFFKFYKKERKQLKSPKSLPELNDPKVNLDMYVMAIETVEYRGIPFIDADVGFYSDAYIPLAKHEMFCE